MTVEAKGRRTGWAGLALGVMLAAALVAIPGGAAAQYRVFDWLNFNEGKLPPSLSLGHDASPEVVWPVNLSASGMPADILGDVSRTECGPYSLSFTPTAKQAHLSVLSPLALDRNLLGDTGRALFQADFYVPAEGELAPSMSLLAAFDEKGEKKAYRWYRFGTMPEKNIVFFAYLNGTERPEIFHTQKMATMELKRPGWNRFQIVFEGRERIFCAVNGQPTTFPPIAESTLRLLNAGVLVTRPTIPEGQEASLRPGIIDNLSIQYTPAAAEFPDSPWIRKQEIAFDLTTGEASLLDPSGGLKWHDNTADAWAASKSSQKPLLIMWYTPRTHPYQYLESIMPKDSATRAMLDKYVLLRVDVNQLNGGFQAQRYNIVRVPTLMVLTPDGREQRRLPVITNQTKADAVLEVLRAS